MSELDGEGGPVSVALYNDRDEQRETASVTKALAGLFGFARDWSKSQEKGKLDLTFSSMMAAMMASDGPVCSWLRQHLSLRGVASEAMTKPELVLRGGLETVELASKDEAFLTTHSFRTALTKARELKEKISPDKPLGVRHYMAAYAVCPQYHLHDFLRLKIDRRAWCLELAEELTRRYPDEKAGWEQYATEAPPVPVLAFNADAPDGRDLLSLEREVESFARLIASRSTATPMSIGVFGAWGSGKSFFMRRVRERVARYAERGRTEGRASPFHGQVAQIELNAWHYSEGNLVACLVDHIFRNLRIGGEDEDDATLRRRGEELATKLERAKETLALRDTGVATAEDRRRAAQREIERIDAQLPPKLAAEAQALDRAVAAHEAAKAALRRAEQIRDAEIEAQRTQAIALAFVGAVDESGKVDAMVGQLGPVMAELRNIRSLWKPIALGALLVGAFALTARLSTTEAYAQMSAVASALAGAATVALALFGKMKAVVERGAKLEAEAKQKAVEGAKRIREAHQANIDALAKAAQQRDADRKNAATSLDQARSSSAEAKKALELLDVQRAAASRERDAAAAEVSARAADLDKLSSGTLLDELLEERSRSDGYRSLLTIFTRVRNDFERLSRLMDRATAEYHASDKAPAPTVSRIVLYIDDLDRCPEDKVLEVLRVVHLLLAFRLFVCVVAVDPRWVMRSLRNQPGLAGAPPSRRANASSRAAQQLLKIAQLEGELGAPATPTDYLEKIFQIPLWLRPLPQQNVAAVVRSLLDPSLASTAQPPPAPVAAPKLPAEPAKGATKLATTSQTTPRPIDKQLEIGPMELAYLDQLAPLLGGNPRALKRFANTYRLVKTALSDVEAEVFLGGAAHEKGNFEHQVRRYLPYRMCMAQLAIMCTQRDRALALVQHAEKSRAVTVSDWLDKYKKEVPDREPHLAETLRTILAPESDALSPLSELRFDTFKLWLERTRRYSFYV